MRKSFDRTLRWYNFDAMDKIYTTLHRYHNRMPEDRPGSMTRDYHNISISRDIYMLTLQLILIDPCDIHE